MTKKTWKELKQFQRKNENVQKHFYIFKNTKRQDFNKNFLTRIFLTQRNFQTEKHN